MNFNSRFYSMSTKPKRKPGTLVALERRLGVSKRRVAQLLEAGMPEDPDKAVAWRAEREGGDSSAEALRRERIGLIRAQRERAQFELEAARGKWMSRHEVMEAQTRVAWAVKAALLRLESEFPPLALGLENEVAIQRALRPLLRQILHDLSDRHSNFWTEYPEPTGDDEG